MPHCILEYSDNIVDPPDMRDLLTRINNTLSETGIFKRDDIKSRATRHSEYVIGDGDPSRAFVTLNVAILSGRSVEIRQDLADQCLAVLREAFAESLARLKCSITVQISGLDRESYRRAISYEE